MLQSSLLLWGYFYLFRQNGSQHLWKCLLKGMKEPSVLPWTTGSWQVLASASWISPLGQPKYHAPNFDLNSLAAFSTFDAIEIIAFLRVPSRWALPWFAKTGFANNWKYQGKVSCIANVKEKYLQQNLLANVRQNALHFADFLRFFYLISTTLSRGDFPPSEGWEIPLCMVVWILKNFAKYCKSSSFSRGFRKAFAKFFLGVLLRKTHIFADFRTSFQFSQCYSIFAAFAIFAIGVSLCFAKFRK